MSQRIIPNSQIVAAEEMTVPNLQNVAAEEMAVHNLQNVAAEEMTVPNSPLHHQYRNEKSIARITDPWYKYLLAKAGSASGELMI